MEVPDWRDHLHWIGVDPSPDTSARGAADALGTREKKGEEVFHTTFHVRAVNPLDRYCQSDQ